MARFVMLVLLFAFACHAKAEITPFADTYKEDAESFFRDFGEDFVTPQLKAFEKYQKSNRATFLRTSFPLTLWKYDSAKKARITYHVTGVEMKREKPVYLLEERVFLPNHGWFTRSKTPKKVKRVDGFAKLVSGQSFVDAVSPRQSGAVDSELLRRFAAFLYFNGFDWEANHVLTLMGINFPDYKEAARVFMREQHGWSEGAEVEVAEVGYARNKLTLPGTRDENNKVTFGKEFDERLEAWEADAKQEITLFTRAFETSWEFVKKAEWKDITEEESRSYVSVLPFPVLSARFSAIKAKYADSKIFKKETSDYKPPRKRKPFPKIKGLGAIAYQLPLILKASEADFKKIESKSKEIEEIRKKKKQLGDGEITKAYKRLYETAKELFPVPGVKGKRKAPVYLALQTDAYRYIAEALNGASRPKNDFSLSNSPQHAKEAIALYTAMLRHYPNSMVTRLYRARMYLSLVEFKSCAKDLDVILNAKDVDPATKGGAESLKRQYDRQIKIRSK